jgi:hypothetical protein
MRRLASRARCGEMGALLDSSDFHAAPPAGDRRLREVSTLYVKVLGLALRRPRLIPHLVAAAWAFRARDWYSKPPFLPLPSRSYMRWRIETAYGDPDASPPLSDLERYLVWTSRMRREMRRPVSDSHV